MAQSFQYNTHYSSQHTPASENENSGSSEHNYQDEDTSVPPSRTLRFLGQSQCNIHHQPNTPTHQSTGGGTITRQHVAWTLMSLQQQKKDHDGVGRITMECILRKHPLRRQRQFILILTWNIMKSEHSFNRNRNTNNSWQSRHRPTHAKQSICEMWNQEVCEWERIIHINHGE